MDYSEPHILRGNRGNNSFAWKIRQKKYGKTPTLTIPTLITGNIDDVKIGEEIVFEEEENGILRSCPGLKHFVRLASQGDPVVTIFDNHNHALYFWIEAMRNGLITPGAGLIHIDEHSDLWDNPHDLDLTRAIEDPTYAWEFTNLDCNVGNYIRPALQSGLIGEMIRVENEYQIDTYIDYTPSDNMILNIDLDIFAPELGHIPDTKIIQMIQNLTKHAKIITIASSPFFIDQRIALQRLAHIFH